MQNPFEAYLHDLREDQWGTKGPGLKAVAYFCQAAEEGTDLSPVVPQLIDAFEESHQLPIMRPIAEALTLHYLHRLDAPGFRSLLRNPGLGQYVLEALKNICRRGVDISALLPLVVECFSPPPVGSLYDRAGVLEAYMGRSPTSFSHLVDLILANDAARPGLTAWLRELFRATSTVDLGIGAAFIARFPGLEATEREALAGTLLHIYLRRAPSADEEHALVGFLADPVGAVKTAAAHILAGCSLTRGHYPAVDALLGRAEVEVRLGALRALELLQDRSREHDRFRLDRVVRALADLAPRVQEQAQRMLTRKEWRLLSIVPARETLQTVLQGREDPASTASLVAYLTACLSRSPEYARSLLETLRAMSPDLSASPSSASSSGPAWELVRACEEMLVGQHAPACTLCEALPRNAQYSHEIDLPLEARRLQDLPYGGLKQCPECKTYYYYNYSEEWERPSDGMGLTVVITLKRLPPTEAVKALTGNDLEAYQGRSDDLLAGFRAALSHPRPWMREEAGWVLTLLSLEEQRLDQADRLLCHPDLCVRLSVSSTLLPRIHAGLDVQPLEETFWQTLDDPDPTLSARAAEALCRQYWRHDRRDRIHALLRREETPIRRAVLLSLYQLGRESETLADFLLEVQANVAHADQKIRLHARSLLTESKRADLSAGVEAYAALLAEPGGPLREEAIQALGKLVSRGGDIRCTLPVLAEALSDPNLASSALTTLKMALQAGTDIAIALPRLIEWLEDPQRRSKDDVLPLLDSLFKRQIDIRLAIPALGRLAVSQDGRVRAPAITLLEALSRSGIDLTEIIPTLKQRLPTNDSYGESTVYILTRHHLAHEDWDEINAQLAHRQVLVRAATGQVLQTAAQNGLDLSPCVPCLVEALVSTRESHCYSLSGALQAFVGADPGRASAVQERLSSCGEGKAKPSVQKVLAVCLAVSGSR